MGEPREEEREVCRAPAEILVFRGRTARLWLCRAHRSAYTGRGKVVTYSSDGGPADFLGQERRCGEATE